MDEYGRPSIAFEFGGTGAAEFGELTGNNVGAMLCIVLDDTMVSQATINTRIDGRGQIEGRFTQDEVDDTVTLLRAGSLPAKPRLANEQTIGALLGRDSVDSGTQAMLIGFVGVVVFMLCFYGIGGVVSNIALLLNLLFLIAAVKIFRNTMTLPGMAGLLLTVGMAVDANILIFARIREEKLRGRGLAQAVQAGYQRVFWTIFDSNATTLITAYILYKFGSGAVKGFAIILSIGLITSFFTSIYVTRLIFTFLIRAGWVKELRMMSVLSDPKIDWLARARVFAGASALFIAVGLAVLTARGRECLGLDFTGGSRLVVNLTTPGPESRMRERIASITDESGDRLYEDVLVQSIGEGRVVDGEKRWTVYSVRTRQIAAKVEAAPAPVEGSAPVLRPAATTDESTDRFRRLVEEALVADQLLAPEGITDAQVTVDPPQFAATLHFVDEAGTLTTAQLEQLLAEAGFPVTEVRDRAVDPANPRIVSFRGPRPRGPVEPAAPGAARVDPRALGAVR
jgi:protein-export SecD/SecF family membrane protein